MFGVAQKACCSQRQRCWCSMHENEASGVVVSGRVSGEASDTNTRRQCCDTADCSHGCIGVSSRETAQRPGRLPPRKALQPPTETLQPGPKATSEPCHATVCGPELKTRTATGHRLVGIAHGGSFPLGDGQHRAATPRHQSIVSRRRQLERCAASPSGSRSQRHQLSGGYACVLGLEKSSVGMLCRQEHLTRDFTHAPCTCDHTHIVAQGVAGAQSLHPHTIHDVTCLRVRCWSSFCLLSLYLSLRPFLFHSLPVLCAAHQLPQCRICRGLNPVRTRTLRSIAPWRCTTLSRLMSPSSSATSTAQRLLQ